MKLSVILSASLLIGISANATEATDTVASIENPATVKVITQGNKQTIIISGSKDNPDYHFEYESEVSDSLSVEPDDLLEFNPIFLKKSSKKHRNPEYNAISDIYAGAVIPTDYDRGMNRTGWEIGMLNVTSLRWHLSRVGTDLSIGIGWQYRHLTIGDGMMSSLSENNALILTPIPQEYAETKSTLKSFSLQIPLTLSQRIYKSFTFEIGGVAMLNTYTSGKVTWKEGDISSKMSIKHLHQRILTADAIARIGLRNSFAFYIRYSPMSQFKSNFGPQYNSISIGASLGF